MIFTPTYRIANFIVKRLISAFGLNIAFYKLFTSLFQISGNLILSVGIFPFIRVLFTIFKCIYNKNSLTVLTNILQRYNPIIVSKILEIIQPFWNICIKNHVAFKNLFYIYFIAIILSSIKILSFIIVRFIFGIVLASFSII
jgi:hypothetical protein